MVTVGGVERSRPVAKIARKVVTFAVFVLKAPSLNVTALMIAPSRVPVPNSEKIPGAAVLSTVIVVENVPLDEVTVKVCGPTGVAAPRIALICVGET